MCCTHTFVVRWHYFSLLLNHFIFCVWLFPFNREKSSHTGICQSAFCMRRSISPMTTVRQFVFLIAAKYIHFNFLFSRSVKFKANVFIAIITKIPVCTKFKVNMSKLVCSFDEKCVLLFELALLHLHYIVCSRLQSFF